VKQPISGIQGSKPGAGPPKPDGKLSREESRALDKEYRMQRNQTLALKNMQAQMLLAKARGELIEKRLAQLQASFLLVAMRRAALVLPQALCGRLAAVADPDAVRAILDEAVRGFLGEVQDLPNRIRGGLGEVPCRGRRQRRAFGVGGKARAGPNAPPKA
jgi:hypothetical protein